MPQDSNVNAWSRKLIGNTLALCLLWVQVPLMIKDKIAPLIRGSALETVFWKCKIWQMETQTIEFTTPPGKFSLEVPAWREFNNAHRNDGYEPLLTSELNNRLTNDSVYFDVGSRWGYFTKMATFLTADERIHGFDSNPRWFDLLKRNHDQDAVNLMNTYVSSEVADRTITLNDYVDEDTLPDILKIDVEGAEYDVLQGMSEILNSTSPVLFIEIHPAYLRNRDLVADDVFDYLEEYEYSIDIGLEHRSKQGEWTPLPNCGDLPNRGEYLIKAKNPDF